MPIVTTTILPPPIQQTFNQKLLSVKVPELIHQVPAMMERMPKHGGNIMRFRRYSKLPTATVPLGNSGVTPPSGSLSAINIDATMETYGYWLEINELVTLTAQDRPLNEAARLLGMSIRETEDELMKNMLAATASSINCTGGVNGDNPTEITRSDINLLVATLLGNDAKTVFSSIEGANKFGSAPVRNSYFALGHTDLSRDLDAVDGFTHTSQYPSQNNLPSSEWGGAGNLRFLLSSVGFKATAHSALGADEYNIFCVGMEAYAGIEQDGLSAQFIYRPPIYSGPLAQNATAGWKMRNAQRILNDSWIINLKCTLA